MIVDANIAVYWFVPGPCTEGAEEILRRPDLKAPALIRIEAANALLAYLRKELIQVDQLFDALDELNVYIGEFVSDGDLLSPATEIALADNHKIYDCLYLALAMQRREPLATADRRLAALARLHDVETELIQPSR